MAMEARLSLRQSQRVVMTPLLQQAIQLLQLSTLELQEVVQKELLENPLLEEMPVDGAETPEAGEATPSAEATPAPTVEPITVDPPPTAERQTDELPFDPISVMFDEPEERSLVAQEERHFEDLSRRRYADIARALKLSADRIMESVEEIMALEPKPGRRFGGNDSRYIVPDVFVYKLGSDYTVMLNEEGIPRLRVNSLYRSLLRSSGDEARQYVEQKLRSALWLIKSVDQRQRTLRKVTQSIVKFQREFLDKGLPYLRPLSLRDVGEDISMHESTIRRVATNKYVETPQGLFELKFFFHSGIASGDGEMVSSVSVKKMIQDLLANEDAVKPLSDQEVAGILKGRGLTIARRTVAKYREELGIVPSHQRRLQPRKR